MNIYFFSRCYDFLVHIAPIFFIYLLCIELNSNALLFICLFIFCCNVFQGRFFDPFMGWSREAHSKAYKLIWRFLLLLQGFSINTFDLKNEMYPIIYGRDAPNTAAGATASHAR